MNNDNNILRNKAYDKLPVHRPDDDLWEQISARLDKGAADNYQEALSEMPVHMAPPGIWENIERQLSKRRYRLALVWLGIATAASVAVFTMLNFPFNPARQPGNTSSPALSLKKTGIHSDKVAVSTVPATHAEQSSAGVTANNNNRVSDNHTSDISLDIKALDSFNQVRLTLPKSDRAELAFISYRPQLVVIYSPETSNVRAYPDPLTLPSFGSMYDPKAIQPEKTAPRLSLSLAYLPESIDNGYNPAIFHNVDFAASIDMKNMRFRSSMGMAYNSEHYDYTVKATRNTDNFHSNPVTDSSLYAMVETLSNFEGVERHGFVSWDIGAGRKLFTTRKLTTWINAGAGLSIRINNANLRDETVETMLNSYNSTVNSIDLDDPLYNRMNMSLVSGIEFDYRLLKRLSLTVQPQVRYYLHPIFKDSETSPDSYSLGFRTGMKFDL